MTQTSSFLCSKTHCLWKKTRPHCLYICFCYFGGHTPKYWETTSCDDWMTVWYRGLIQGSPIQSMCLVPTTFSMSSKCLLSLVFKGTIWPLPFSMLYLALPALVFVPSCHWTLAHTFVGKPPLLKPWSPLYSHPKLYFLIPSCGPRAPYHVLISMQHTLRACPRGHDFGEPAQVIPP